MAADRKQEAQGADERPAPVPFTVGFHRGQSSVLVFGSLAFGIIFAGVGLAGGMPLLAVAALAPLANAYWHYPMIEKGRPQLGANEEGLFLERAGFIDWGAIRMTDVKRSKSRNADLVRLDVLLTRPLKDALASAQRCPPWKRFMMRNWKRTPREHGRELVAINLHTLDADPDELLARIRAFKFV